MRRSDEAACRPTIKHLGDDDARSEVVLDNSILDPFDNLSENPDEAGM